MWLDRQALVIGQEGCDALRRSRVAVIGIGGVGGAAAEALCRCGIGGLLVIDHDRVDDTNRNRQLLATAETVGRRKVAVLGERLREALQTDEEGDFCFPLRGGRCPFLNRENLCEIHRILGAEATSLTCRTHPRFIEEYGPFREVSLCASCPAACDLLLGSTDPLSFLERETAEPEEPGDPWLCGLLPLRERMLRELADRPRPLQERLEAFLLLAAEAQILLDEDRTEDLAALAADWKKQETAVPPGPGLFPHALRVLSKLEALDGDWRELLRRAEEAPPVAVPETLLERLGTYFAFRYLLKAVNDGDLLGQAQFCVLMVLTAQRLTAVCGLWEAVRRLCCEVEHSEENLEALRLAFLRDAALSPGAFLCQMRS